MSVNVSVRLSLFLSVSLLNPLPSALTPSIHPSIHLCMYRLAEVSPVDEHPEPLLTSSSLTAMCLATYVQFMSSRWIWAISFQICKLTDWCIRGTSQCLHGDVWHVCQIKPSTVNQECHHYWVIWIWFHRRDGILHGFIVAVDPSITQK